MLNNGCTTLSKTCDNTQVFIFTYKAMEYILIFNDIYIYFRYRYLHTCMYIDLNINLLCILCFAISGGPDGLLELFVTLLLFPEVYQVWTTKHVRRQILVALYCLSFTFYQGSFMEETPSYGLFYSH